MKVLVTGGAGFIGSHFVDGLIARGDEVVVYDDLRTGHEFFLGNALASGRCELKRGDVLDGETLADALRGCDAVAHFAANADVRGGLDRPTVDLEQNTLATSCLLQAMRRMDVQRLVFSSTGVIYGEPDVFPTPEDAPLPVQTSLYGASKIAAEGLISAYAHGFGMKAWIFRFVSILGPRYSHGHVFDFTRKLLADPTRIEVLGDGRQRKSYLHVEDCVRAILTAMEHEPEPVEVLNLGHRDDCVVDESLAWICERMGVTPEVHHTGGERGWIGDSPRVDLCTRRMEALGWSARRGIRESVEDTVDYLLAHRRLFDAR